MEIEPVTQIVSSLGVAAVLGWFLYYKTAIADPRRDEETLRRMDAMQDRQSGVIKSVCEDFTTCLREEREVRREELQALRADISYHRQAAAAKQD